MTALGLNIILKQAPYLTKQNLALVLDKKKDNLDYWLKKLLREKLLIALKKGFYIPSYYLDLVSQNPVNKELYGEYLANVLRFPSYVSLEYVLAKKSLLPEAAFAITSITSKTSRVYKNTLGTFIYRNIKRALYGNYKMVDFNGKKVRIASTAKALFDFLYLKKFNSATQLKAYLLSEGRINWQVLSKEDRREFVKLSKLSSSTKMQLVVSLLKKQKIV